MSLQEAPTVVSSINSGLPLLGQVALVTGASRGIGKAIVQRFAAEGADIALHYRSGEESAHALSETIREQGRRVELIQADLSGREGPQRLAKVFQDRKSVV